MVDLIVHVLFFSLDDSSGVAVEPVAVVIAGINIILPMMNEEILKVRVYDG